MAIDTVFNKIPTHVFFYICVENVKIYTKFSGYVLQVKYSRGAWVVTLEMF